jgi:hypothetical protein
MAKEFVAGISYSGETAQTVVLELSEHGTVLRFLQEHLRADGGDTWFLDAFLSSRDRFVEKTTRVSVGLDHAALLLYKFPVDTSLTRPEQNEHVQWELATVLAKYQPREYINDLHYLAIQAREQTADVFVVNVRRSLIFSIQALLAQKKFNLHIADANYFGAQHALLSSYPSVKSERVLLAGFSRGRVDIGLVQSGRLLDYQYALFDAAGDLAATLREIVARHAPSALYYFGMDHSANVMAEIRGELDLAVLPLNPFNRIAVQSSLQGYAPFEGSEHRLASCVGLALRKV